MAGVKKKRESEKPSLRRLNSVCIFGGSSLGKDYDFIVAATELANVLTNRKICLVYGGGIYGLRGCVATSALLRGNHVLSVSLKDLVNKDANHHSVGMELKVSNMYQRFGYMLNNAGAFIALPGGLETLEGISSIAYWIKLNLHKKPLGLLNINGFYDGLLSFLDHAVEQKFISQAIRRAIMSASTADELID